MEAQQKRRLIYGLTGKELALLEFDKAIGLVSKFIGRLCMNDPEMIWKVLKKTLVDQFAGERIAIKAVQIDKAQAGGGRDLHRSRKENRLAALA